MKTLLSTSAREVLLAEKDESYGNTSLHVACSLHSIYLTKLLLEAGASLEEKNLAGRTPFEVVESEIELYRGYVDSNNNNLRDMSLERLQQVKSLFN